MFIDIRVFYHKILRAKYISHLDISRLMQRCLKRSGLSIWYTQGFNPHMYVSFALPLSLGYESIYEAMDLRLTTESNDTIDFDKIKQIINECLPTDIIVKKVDYPKYKVTLIKAAAYNVLLKSNTLSSDNLMSNLTSLLNQDTINVLKKTKKGLKEIDIKPFISVKNISTLDGQICFDITTCAGVDKNVNPTLLVDALSKKMETDDIFPCIKRTAIYVDDGELFV